MKRPGDPKDWGIAILRVAVGGVFVAHGAQKLFVYGIPGVSGLMGQLGIPLPGLSAILVTAAELLGGLALVAGFWTRLAALPLAFSMAVAAATVHLRHGFFLPEGAEYVLTLFLAALSLSLLGSGAWSVDRALARRAAPGAPVSAPDRRPQEAVGR